MQNNMEYRETANEKGAAGIIFWIIFLIILASVGYSEVLFLSIVTPLFPDGLLRGVAILGAITTGASIVMMFFAKRYHARPGAQLLFSWIFMFVEMIVLVLNDILAQEQHAHHVDAYLNTWSSFAPAVPVLALVGWMLYTYLDPERKQKHALMEMADEKHESQVTFARAQHRAQMQLQHMALNAHTNYLTQAIYSVPMQDTLQQGAYSSTANWLSGFTGLPVNPMMNRQPPAQAASFAQTAPAPEPPNTVAADQTKGLPPPAQPSTQQQAPRRNAAKRAEILAKKRAPVPPAQPAPKKKLTSRMAGTMRGTWNRIKSLKRNP